MRLCKTLDDSSISEKLKFKLNHVLGEFHDERYGDNDLIEGFKKFHGLVEDTINQFIPTKVSKQTNCKQSWVDNEVKNLASLKNNNYQNFLNDKSEPS